MIGVWNWCCQYVGCVWRGSEAQCEGDGEWSKPTYLLLDIVLVASGIDELGNACFLLFRFNEVR